ncbi:uncharacterized protein [Bemisia tabaci]|uniref:uncharacterized protein isoform X2 n=1 Tax=Bemisia tabaci TaxID=7038 RepID=UPI003B284AEF
MSFLNFKCPRSLYNLCIEVFVSVLKNVEEPAKRSTLVQKLAPSILEDVMLFATWNTRSWSQDWSSLLTASIRAAVVPYQRDILQNLKNQCKALRQILFLPTSDPLDVDVVLSLPKHVISVDFNGDYFHRSRTLASHLLLQSLGEEESSSWLIEAESVLRSMLTLRQKIPDYIFDNKYQSITELHLSTVKVSVSDIQKLFTSFPKLKYLRHYQLTAALYELHVEDWKQNLPLPAYKLKNLDADFSYVVRSQWTPRRSLPVDAFQLATILCPDTNVAKIRFDCSTNHDSISPLINLKKLKELSLVRVTDGERCLLDFTDITLLLQKHGKHLIMLELKVIEEVDTHVILESCSRLEVLILSGCSYRFPEPTCETSCLTLDSSSEFLTRLQYFFYADGDDFSSDHSLPQCFWKSLLTPDRVKMDGKNYEAYFSKPRAFRNSPLGKFSNRIIFYRTCKCSASVATQNCSLSNLFLL